jgi:hypothetical protein
VFSSHHLLQAAFMYFLTHANHTIILPASTLAKVYVVHIFVDVGEKNEV